MMFEPSSLSERFRKRHLAADPQGEQEIRFVLAFDSFGAYLEIQNPRGKVVTPDYQVFTGPTRSLLRMIQQLQGRRDFLIDWEKPADRIYLGEHEFLLWQLKICGNVFDETGRQLYFTEGKAKVSIQIEEVAEGSRLRSFLRTERESRIAEDLMVLSESFLLCDQEIYEITPLGEAYEDLYLFQTEFVPKDLESFLSLLFSHVNHIGLQYKDFQLHHKEEPIRSQPCLILEQIDEENALHLRVSQQLPGIEFDFLETYELSKLAEVNELERRIMIRPIEDEQLGAWVQEIRALLEEAANQAKLRKELVIDGNRFIVPEGIAGEFLYHELPTLLNRYQFFGAEHIKNYQVRAFQPKLDLSLQSGIDFFEGEAFLDFEGESIALLDALKQYRQNRYIQLTDGTHAIVRKEYFQKLERLFQKGKKGEVRISFFDLPEVELLLANRLLGEGFTKNRDVFEGFNQLHKLEVPAPPVDADLRPYQYFGYQWLTYLHQNKLGGCLADDMGLGKTLQTLAILGHFVPQTDKPSVIVMPRSLLFNWQREIEKFTPQLKATTYYGPQRSWEEASTYPLILTTYGTLR
ncbi:MAG: SNF2-related protein, partial [Bacteroidota bacterium]